MHLEPDSNEQQVNPFASALEPVWAKVRTATALMVSLREEKVHLEEKVAELEDELRRTNEVLANQAAEVARLKAQLESSESSPHGPVQCPAALGAEERVQLQQKIKTALSKIETYLSAS
jgi:uncharacterized coiled-coil DUF342 family protein